MIIYTIDGQIAYDERFHKGVNIIRGDNSSGKSTISHFIFFVLGGAFNDWVKEAKKCSHVIAEIEMNEAKVTIKRKIKKKRIGEEIKINALEGIYFYWDTIEQALENHDGWQKFNYNTTAERKSFSNVFFENLGLPIVQGENNITIHQILRLLYIDQDSPTSSLFLYENFDSSLTRETVANLLLGVYDQNLYDQKQRKVEAEKELDEVTKEIKVIKRFISNPHDLIPSNLQVRIEQKEKEINSTEEKIIQIKEEEKKIRFSKKTKLEFEKLNAEALSQREAVVKLEKELRRFSFEIEDTELFIDALKDKLKALKKSILTRKLLGEFPLENCPECLSPLEPAEEENTCKLCKNQIDDSYGITQAKKMEQELSFQIKESKNLILLRKKQLVKLEIRFESEKDKLFRIQKRVNTALNDVRSVKGEKLDQLYEDKGFIEGEILQLRTLYENAEIYQNYLETKVRLDQEIETLKFNISKLTAEQEKLKFSLLKAIETKGVFLLNNDLKRQKEFFQAKEFHIDFRNNIAFISDKDAKYSASSSFYLKNSARFSLFLASLAIPKMRYPRFILSDNMEDKGIEKERAQNFQRILVQQAESFNKDHYQMIYTTSFIPPELDNENYTVGEYYTESNPSLKHVE